MTDSKKRKEINDYLEQIKQEFKSKTGFTLYALPYEEIEKPKRNLKTLYHVHRIINEEFNVNIRNKTRKRKVMVSKQAFCKITRDLGYRYQKIGSFLGNDHSSIIHNCKAAEDMLAIKDPEMQLVYNKIIKRLDAQ